MQRNPHRYQIATSYRTSCSLRLVSQPIKRNLSFFIEKPEILTREEKRAWLDTLKGVSLGSDAFFPFGDNIERAHKSGVDYIAQAGGSVRDDHVIDTCDKYGIAMAFTGVRLFHH